jgi:hypothetical protein
MATVQAAAQTNYWNYLSPPAGLSISPSSPTRSSS